MKQFLMGLLLAGLLTFVAVWSYNVLCWIGVV